MIKASSRESSCGFFCNLLLKFILFANRFLAFFGKVFEDEALNAPGLTMLFNRLMIEKHFFVRRG